MAKVSVLNVAVLENPSPFHSPFRFEISFECSEALSDGEARPGLCRELQTPLPLFFASMTPAPTSRRIRPCALYPALSRGGLLTARPWQVFRGEGSASI